MIKKIKILISRIKQYLWFRKMQRFNDKHYDGGEYLRYLERFDK